MIYYQDEWVTQYCSDALTVLQGLESDSIDLLCTDPPYGIGFMGKDWDKALPDKAIWTECLRVLKPGAFAFVMSIPRADCLSRMIISLEDAGFRVDFSPIYWAYASGFPKAQNIGKAVDKRNDRVWHPEVREYLNSERIKKGLSFGQINKLLGTALTGGGTASSLMGDKRFNELPTVEIYNKLKAILELDNRFDELIEREEAEREVVGTRIKARAEGQKSALPTMGAKTEYITIEDTIPETPQAKALDGSYGGFQPKPAVEVIIVAMKPLSEKTFVDQALKNGKGITWLDDCKIPSGGEKLGGGTYSGGKHKGNVYRLPGCDRLNPEDFTNPSGRFPANLIVSDDVLNDGRMSKSGLGSTRGKGSLFGANGNLESIGYPDSGSFSRYFDLDKWFKERIE